MFVFLPLIARYFDKTFDIAVATQLRETRGKSASIKRKGREKNVGGV